MIVRICVLVVLSLIQAVSARTMAANYITVATIGAVPQLDEKQDPQSLVNQVITFWQKELAQVLPDKPDLIVLPELCDLSGAGDEYLGVRKNQIVDFFSSVARENHCYLAYGTKREDDLGLWRNSCIMLDRKGGIAGIYDKNYPTIGEMESGIKAGQVAPLIQCDFGSVAVAICFDLNFEQLREQYAHEKPDLILFCSMYHGGPAQGMWAYTCRSHFVASVYPGNPSEIRNPAGDIVATSTNYFDFAVSRINLDMKLVHLDYNREKLTALKAKYGSGVTILDPGKLGSVMVSSENKEITVDQMIQEFDIELLDDYLNRARGFRYIQ
jgi:hypothetical protein